MNALIIAMIVLFIHSTTWDGMIFGKVKDWIKPEGLLYKPIYGCPICMTPWYGTIIYWLFFASSFEASWKDWLLTVGTAAGMSVLTIVMLSVRDACIKYDEN